jgi:hypothetical protein
VAVTPQVVVAVAVSFVMTNLLPVPGPRQQELASVQPEAGSRPESRRPGLHDA